MSIPFVSILALYAAAQVILWALVIFLTFIADKTKDKRPKQAQILYDIAELFSKLILLFPSKK